MAIASPETPREARQPRPLTGRMVFAMFVAFFGVIIAVNGTMMTLAIETLPGTVTDSSYRSSQRFNQSLAEAREREARRWAVDANVARDGSGTAAVTISLRDAEGAPVDRISVSARLLHPVTRSNDRTFDVARTGPGTYVGTADQAQAGAQDLVIEVKREGETMYRSRNRVLLP
ncbi:FixH family protein [Phreatobacter aquaticus]|nr:FixH family protein [Phreatobacter aquaticus]